MIRLSRFFYSSLLKGRRLYSSESKDGKIKRYIPAAGEVFKDPMEVLREEFIESDRIADKGIPRESDFVIIGGGAIGTAVAYFLAQRAPTSYKITVIERDPSYTNAATVLSVGGLRQQFSLPENVQLSMFTAEFLRKIKDNLGIRGKDPPDVQFNPQGYLFMCTEKGQDILKDNWNVQTENGAKVDLMDPEQLKNKFPWLNTDGVELGAYGIENEGWFDPWLLLSAMRNKATSLGVNYVKGEVIGFKKTSNRIFDTDGRITTREKLETVEVQTDENTVHSIGFAACVNCAGPWAGEVGKMAGIGTGKGVLCVPVPVEPRKRYVYVVHCPDGPGFETPMIIDPSGVYLRREGMHGNYICGKSPDPEDEPDTSNLDVDYGFFEEHIWPVLAHRVPAFEKLKDDDSKHDHLGVEIDYFNENIRPVLANRIPAMANATVKSAWASYYDYNVFDQNLIIGNHPYHRNFIMATGCSGHGIQQAPAIGRAVMELLIDDEFKTINLKRFSFDRILDDEPVFEKCII